MKLRKIVLAAAVVAAGASSMVSTGAFAQAKEQYLPVLSYRTGVNNNDTHFKTSFPYVATPWRGTEVGQ